MANVRFLRFLGAGLTTAALSAALLGPVAPAMSDDPAPWKPPRPTNAGKIFRWGHAQTHDEFHGPTSSRWQLSSSTQIRNQHGMLTLNGTENSGTLTATFTGAERQYGRWEARVRAKQYTAKYTPFTAVWELVPRGPENCGARGIVVSEYTIGQNVASLHLRNTPDVDFTDSKVLRLDNQEFHTYAVEVTPDHISWFIDTQVVMTERRDAARTGATYDIRFRLVAPPGARMNKGRMQMDWVRYYTLKRKNAQSIEAPQATRTTYAAAC